LVAVAYLSRENLRVLASFFFFPENAGAIHEAKIHGSFCGPYFKNE
jgi:hypothetical protein